MATNRTTILATTALWACLIATCTDAKYLEIVRPSKEDRSLGEVRGLEDIALEEFGATPASNKMPLQRCQGDCDTDDDCAGYLVCYQRASRGGGDVPGCLNGAEHESRSDFCIRPEAVTGAFKRTSASGSSTLTFETQGSPTFITDSDAPASSASLLSFIYAGGIVSVVMLFLF